MRLLKRGLRALANRSSGWAWNRTAHSGQFTASALFSLRGSRNRA
jgi:hypothetical protein